MQSLQALVVETNQSPANAESHPVAMLEDTLERLGSEIRDLYKAELPPAVIHQIVRGAREQAAIARMMVEDCALRQNNGTLNPKHLANARKWIAGVARWIENRQASYLSGSRRKLCIVRSAR